MKTNEIIDEIDLRIEQNKEGFQEAQKLAGVKSPGANQYLGALDELRALKAWILEQREDKLLAFHNDHTIKAKYLARVEAHMAADELIKGVYWEDGKGCAVGCTIHSGEHSSYEDELGIPRVIAKLEDRIFEGLSNELAMTWPRRFLEAIPVGKDLSRVWPMFAIFLLTDKTQCASRHQQCDIVADKFRKQLVGETVDWKATAAAAAVDAAAAYAAYAADAAAYAAAYAAAAYASAAYASDARQKAYIAQSEELLRLLAEVE